MSGPTHNDDLIYRPAKRGNVGVLIMLAGGSGSGKTKSALRLATGFANGGTIGFCDTEHGRALYYADEFKFEHLELKEPFTPSRFEAAAVVSQKAGHAVWVCDSFSHEHVGPGGVLDMQEAELQRMTRGDDNKRDALKYTSWIKPKMEHKHMLQRLWQLNTRAIILCCHAEKKLELIKGPKGKMIPNPDAEPQPVCAPDIPYAMTCSFILDAKRPGVPRWLKPLDKLMGMIDLNSPLDEETGARIAAWARGETVAPIAQTRSSRPAASAESPMDIDDAPYWEDEPATPTTPAEDPAAVKAADDLAALFLGTADMKAHFVLVDRNVKLIADLKKFMPRLWKQVVEPAMKASVVRNTPPAGEPAGPDSKGSLPPPSHEPGGDETSAPASTEKLPEETMT